VRYFEGCKASRKILNTSAQRRDPTTFFQVRVQRTRAFVTDYVGKVASRLEAPMRGLFVYWERYLHGVEVHNRLNRDQGLGSKLLQSTTETHGEDKNVRLSRRDRKGGQGLRVKESDHDVVWVRIS
jgi:hypothetical protein